MQEKVKSEGKCLFCGKTFAKAGINRHLATHLKEKTTGSKSGVSFLVKVETDKRWGITPYFLSLWIDGEATMENFDSFLRSIWLECCGHASSFYDPQKRNRGSGMPDINSISRMFDDDYDDFEEEEYPGEISMNKKVKDVFYKGLVLDYEYDFGSTTELTITVFEIYPMKADKKIVLLSRNEPPVIMCFDCGKVPATQICSVCLYSDIAIFCDKCAKKHAKKCADFADGASLPVVNSPRMGVCAYDGGLIDTERDK